MTDTATTILLRPMTNPNFPDARLFAFAVTGNPNNDLPSFTIALDAALIGVRVQALAILAGQKPAGISWDDVEGLGYRLTTFPMRLPVGPVADEMLVYLDRELRVHRERTLAAVAAAAADPSR